MADLYRKGIIAAAGAVLTVASIWALGGDADDIAVTIVPVLTALGVYAVPNERD